MERISNSLEELRKSAKFEIENFDLKPEEKVIAYFSEFPSIAGFPYKIVLVESDNGTIFSKFRQWDTKYDFDRWDQGIYNLDRLRILSETKILSESDTNIFRKWLFELDSEELPQSIKDEKAIVLDGSDWEFGICLENTKVDYQWKAVTNAIDLFVPIIELMKNQHATKNQRH